MFQRLYTLALNTFVETVRQPIYGVILLATTLLMILNVSLAGFTLSDDNKLLLDLGLSTLLLSGLFLSAFSATGVISREIENKTVLTVISKPVSRPVFIVGKFVGLIAALTVAFYLNSLVFILAVRHGVMEATTTPWDQPVWVFGGGAVFISFVAGAFCNYFYGRHFSTITVAIVTPLLTLAVLGVGFFGKEWESIPYLSDFVGGQVIIATYLVWLAVMMTASVAIAASTRCGQLTTLIICTGVVGLGVISDYAFGHDTGDGVSAMLSASAYHLVPNIGPLWVVEGLTVGTIETAVPFVYVGYATAYVGLITLGVLGLAVALFQKREVG